MSQKRHPLKIITRFIHQFFANTKKQLVWLLRTISGTRKKQNAGFVLPTVAMVSVVVVLLTTAIVFRSFDRAKNASNVRVNDAVLSAATPAIDRGRAKINKLFKEESLPRATPTDSALYSLLLNKLDSYTLGDETQLQIGFDFTNGAGTSTTGNGKIDLPNSTTAIYNNETVNTAWMYPVDTNNNGKFDSYTLYTILFRTPNVNSNGQSTRKRNPLEARTIPMAAGNLSASCGASTSASLVGNSGWITQDNKTKKSFFVYTATVPITTTPADTTNYETYQGSNGFAAIEYQQDRVQGLPNNTAVVYEDDISLSPGSPFNINGAVFTNSNILTSSINGGAIRFFQVSSPSSCYYDAKNAKITVGGNTTLGNLTATSQAGSAAVDLYQGPGTGISSGSWINSTTDNPNVTAYNNRAYADRINVLVNAQMTASPTGTNYPTGSTDPKIVKDGVANTLAQLGLTTATTTATDLDNYRSQQLTLYFRSVTRRVPYSEVAFGATDTPPTPILQGAGETATTPNTLRPNNKWIYPTDPTDGKTGTNYTKLALNISGTSLKPAATLPTTVATNSGKEGAAGDRVLVGNNLPAIWWDSTKNEFATDATDTQAIAGVRWDLPSGTTTTRTRNSLVTELKSVGSTDRDGDWEIDAAKIPTSLTQPVGGLRVITGSGIYLGNSTTLSSLSSFPSTSTPTVIWPDTYPVIQSPAPSPITIQPYSTHTNSNANLNPANITFKWRTLADTATPTTTPYLRMRATAVYHYAVANYNESTPKPLACVSSFYVPTNSTTAKNLTGLPWNAATGGLSNNGIVYPGPTVSGYSSAAGTNSNYSTIVSSYSNVLTYQATLTYPNGRLVDGGILARALNKVTNNLTLTLSEQSAIDAQICALQILDGSITPITTTASPTTATPIVEHGTIKETAFLDGRQVYQNSISGTSQTYDMPIKDRQPIEIRSTVLDLDLLRKKPISGSSPTEYLLPNSGIIYVARNDALPDSSAYPPNPVPTGFTASSYQFADALPGDSTAIAQAKTNSKSVSPVDYILDPSRRPNGVMLINGSNLARSTIYNTQEKGLILATSLPAYIQDDFNLHQDTSSNLHQEFTQTLASASDWSNSFYSRSTLDANFACRKGDPRLPSCNLGDTWRPATLLADAVTLLSSGGFSTGYRNNSDFDWNYNYQDQKLSSPYPPLNTGATNIPSGLSSTFSTVNKFATSTGSSSYFNNGDIPVASFSSNPNSTLTLNYSPTQTASADTTFNLIFATGDTPGRTTATANEDNGGLHNFVRFLENWSGRTVNISGAFMQVKKSAYATGPFATSLSNATGLVYPSAGNTAGNISGSNITGAPWYSAPTRLWGYDVALLSQSPDLFASKLLPPPSPLPNEYFREVGRDDAWIQALLCAKSCANGTCPTSSTTTPPTSPQNSTPFAIVDSNQRPSTCTPYTS